ncbi:TPA: CsbD family protein [Streptococcus suis]|nr:CsbD family protein [Streptococcus suis]HEM3672726.1 CsbD family protein [Streptococcus suis]HEM3682444.1 CsbD family protein [Streptococcus suis]HEM3688781.1 CsbD family protein [Streptococcus suis]HEM3690533.1 CsbD family protein [Streptococcus suis]
MSEKLDAKLDQVKGSVKEGFGKLTGDKKVETEGTANKVTGKVKETLADAKDTVKGAVDSLKDK